MIGENTLEQAANVHCRLQIAAFVKIGLTKTRPVCQHAATVKRATEQNSRSARTVIGTARPIRPSSAAELRDYRNYRIRPGVTEPVT